MRTGVLMCVALLAGGVAQADTWGILEPVAREVAASDAQTYRELLQSELSRQLGGGAQVTLITGACSDAGCAHQAGQRAGVDYVVTLTLGTLGTKLVATAAVVDVDDGATLRSERMAIDRVEDLEAVATRLAIAFTTSKHVNETAELGAITKTEERPPTRRHGDSGVSFHIKGVVPFGSALADHQFGMGFDLGFWYEALAFSIEPRVGFRFDTSRDERRTYYAVPIDLSAQYILGLGDFAPFFGGGMGARWTYIATVQTVTDSGGFVQTVHEAEPEDHAWGFGAFARAGVLLFRTYSVRMMLGFEYDVTFVDLHGLSFPQTFQVDLGIVF